MSAILSTSCTKDDLHKFVDAAAAKAKLDITPDGRLQHAPGLIQDVAVYAILDLTNQLSPDDRGLYLRKFGAIIRKTEDSPEGNPSIGALKFVAMLPKYFKFVWQTVNTFVRDDTDEHIDYGRRIIGKLATVGIREATDREFGLLHSIKEPLIRTLRWVESSARDPEITVTNAPRLSPAILTT